MSYEDLWEEIKKTKIHEVLRRDLEYICSVAVFHYPNFVFSVWVFLAILYEEEDF